MSLFEKIEMEGIEADPALPLPPSTRKWTDEPLIIQYGEGRKVLMVICSLLLIPIIWGFLSEDFFVFEIIVLGGVAIGGRYLADCLFTSNITFFPDKIVKNTWFGRTVLPTEALVMILNEQKIHFYHGSEKNLRESIRILRPMVPNLDTADIVKYAEDIYHIRGILGGGAVRPSGKPRMNQLIVGEYKKAVTSYWFMGAFLAIGALIAVCTVAGSDNFSGFSSAVSALPFRLAGVVLTVAAYFLQRRLANGYPEQGTVEARLKKGDTVSTISALVANGVALFGLVLFFLFGNLLDYYLFLLVAVFYFFDFFPQLSTWEKLVKGAKAKESPEPVAAPRRSLQVSLVLMGALAMASQGESRHYLYASKQDCLNDWGDGKDCQEAPSGSGSYGTRYYYGPRYGTGGGRVTRSIGAHTVSRGGFGSLGSFHASFGG